MRARIHRGTSEVGGNIVEVESGGKRIVLDVGLPLDPTAVATDELLPDVPGLWAEGDGSLLGAFISHSHPDHYGLADLVDPTVPIYMGAAAKAVIDEAAFFVPNVVTFDLVGTLQDLIPIELGPFTVTPWLVDHSAFDAYALLVEADGQRLFYSGDLRAHGRKPGTTGRLLAQPPTSIDTLILEGTTLGRQSDDGSPWDSLTETEVENQCVEIFKETPGMALAFYSPQNIDRLVSIYRATLRSGRTLVLDLYAASVVAATGCDSIPQADWDRVRVFVPLSQRVKVKRSREFWRVNELGTNRIHEGDMALDPSKWVMSTRGSMLPDLARAGLMEGASAVWSMWPGYLDGAAGNSLSRLASERVDMTVVHSSGHARIEDLQHLASALDATQIVPIHTSEPEMFGDLFDRVSPREDGEWWDV